ncbi:MAG: caspase family protein [Deltaproteobacteria bacterium]|nr:caspase family protein [Deltaproteobacteria bacterium]
MPRTRASKAISPLAFLAALLLWAAPALGTRLAVVVGNDHGAPTDVVLRFAQADALRVAQVLRELGGVRADDLMILLDQDASSVRRALAAAEKRAQADPEGTTLLFYYSGHADSEAMHLGASRLGWQELKDTLTQSRARLRVGVVDACQAGALTLSKGFMIGASGSPSSRGYAVLTSADVTERAQEATSLGGSIFTHYLVSALRGAADANGDGLVSLAEAHAFTSEHTKQATSSWASSVQHPLYHFDISGHGDLTLTDLREAAAKIQLDSRIEGQVVVTQRGSPLIVVEAQKRAGQALRVAVPAGRYLVHVRKPDAVHVAEVDLPWGGSADVKPEQLVPMSYQSVLTKGGLLEIRRHRLETGGTLQSAVLSGMGAGAGAHVAYGLRFAPLEVEVRVSGSRDSFQAVDTRVDTSLVAMGLVVAYERPLRRLDLRVLGFLEESYWRQEIDKEGLRTALVPGLGVGAGLRIPLRGPLYAAVTGEGVLYLPEIQGVGRTARASARGRLTVGVAF